MRTFFSQISDRLSKAHELLLDVLFPIVCVGCKQEGVWLCKNCRATIQVKIEHTCPICEKMLTPDGRTCLSCKKASYRQKNRGWIENHLDGLIAASSYEQFPIANAVHLFKYRFVSELHVSLGDLLADALRKTDLPLPDLILPVPLHPRRLRWRGFNQSALLANRLAVQLLPQTVLDTKEQVLVRNRYTIPQMSIGKHIFRKQNIAGAFSLEPDVNIKNKTILLVDDIATTGSTIFECAKILKSAGAGEVFAIVVARQETTADDK